MQKAYELATAERQLLLVIEKEVQRRVA